MPDTCCCRYCAAGVESTSGTHQHSTCLVIRAVAGTVQQEWSRLQEHINTLHVD